MGFTGAEYVTATDRTSKIAPGQFRNDDSCSYPCVAVLDATVNVYVPPT